MGYRPYWGCIFALGSETIRRGSKIIPSSVKLLASELLDSKGKLKLYPASFYDEIPFDLLRYFCHFYARYFLPTLEVVDFISNKIMGKKVIEIGAGCGDLGYHLGITMTDNYCQTFPDVSLAYTRCGQPIIEYGNDVLKMDAISAIEKFKPDYVIGAWITQWIDPDLPAPAGGGNIYGVKEDILLKKTGYINIVAQSVHKYKAILKYPHETIKLKSLRSRKQDNTDNVIWIWERNI